MQSDIHITNVLVPQPPVVTIQSTVEVGSWKIYWLVVSTPLKNISQNGNLPQIGLKIEIIWNHQPVYIPWVLSERIFYLERFYTKKNIKKKNSLNIPTSAEKVSGLWTPPQNVAWKIYLKHLRKYLDV